MQYFYNDYYTKPDPPHQPLYLKAIRETLEEYVVRELLDVGCGDANFDESLRDICQIWGLDASESGVAIAQSRGFGFFTKGDLYLPFLPQLNRRELFQCIISVEVIEHLYDPKLFLFNCNKALVQNGLLIITSPYWGYLKNVLLALANRMDGLFSVSWDGGHIKHYSKKSLVAQASRYGFQLKKFYGAGRRPPFLWQGMCLVFLKTSEVKNLVR